MKYKARSRKQKNGSVLVITLIIFGIIVVTALSVALSTLRQTKTSMEASKTNIAYQNADEGIDKVMAAILKGPKSVDSLSGNILINGVTDTGHISGSQCSGSAGSKTIIPLNGNDYSIELLGSCTDSSNPPNTYPYHIDCDASGALTPDSHCSIPSVANDISAIDQLKSTGNDPNAGTQRIVGANVQQKNAKIKLLLHMDMSDTGAGTTVPVDSSRVHHSLSSSGTVGITTAPTLPPISPNYSYAKFNGSSYYLQALDSGIGDWNYISSGGTSPFTVDFWANFNNDSVNITRTFFQLRDTTGTDSLILSYNPSGTRKITLTRAGSTSFSCTYDAGTTDFPSNGWVHIALVENASKDIKLFLQGNKKDFSAACQDNGSIKLNQITIGNSTVANSYFSGYIDEFRFYSDAYFTSGFSVPTEPYK